MEKNKYDFDEMIRSLFLGIYTMIIATLVRSFYWCIPLLVVWNRIIVGLTGFADMTYWKSYWVCVVVMSITYASVSLKK